MYDRSLFVAVARSSGDSTPSDTSRRLGVARNTAWRLWKGRTAPSPILLARIEAEYGVSAGHLLKLADSAEQVETVKAAA